MNSDFAYVDELVSGIRWDAKYATWDNFTGQPVDGYNANRIVGSQELCHALRDARDTARELGLGILIWDGYRPQRAVDCFLRWSMQPEDGRTKLRHYPNIARGDIVEHGYVARRSGHTRGSAVDLTLYHVDSGRLTTMGGDHDLMDASSNHESSEINTEALHNRRHLRRIMESSGFLAYDREWWHYSLRHEPYPNTYFDFPIS